MRNGLTWDEICAAPGASVRRGGVAGDTVLPITTDTRKVAAGDLFVALRGENFDGTAFAAEALERGAAAALVDQKTPAAALTALDAARGGVLVAEDTLRAYQDIAHAWRMKFDIPVVAITGSNGKTTTTSLIYHILREAGYNVELAGNIGRSMALRVAENEEKGDPDWFVLEISSFQLDNMYDFHAHIAVLLNITPDHLDRYGYVMQRYVDSKMRIIRNQTHEDYFIYWADDEHVPNELARREHPARQLPFADRPRAGLAAYGRGEAGDDSYGFAEGSSLVVEQPRPFSIPLAQLSLPGKHNLRNCQAAALATLAAGVDQETLARCLADFPGVEHRLERVGNFDGVQYINDSKATNKPSPLCSSSGDSTKATTTPPSTTW